MPPNLSTMQRTIFISDLHLTESREDITHCFYHFLATHVTDGCDALYILGDFFEVWIGDDQQTPLQNEIAQKLKAISDSGTPVYFIHGNRDFLLGKKYANRAGITLLPEQAVINLYDNKVLIMHGDELCTQDVSYQKFRKTSRSKWWQLLMLNLPLWLRKKIATSAREKSKKNQQGVPLDIMDVVQSDVEQAMLKHDVRLLIHGHTHRPDIHNFLVNDQPHQRIVLGDWYEQGSFLVVTPQSMELNTKSLRVN